MRIHSSITVTLMIAASALVNPLQGFARPGIESGSSSSDAFEAVEFIKRLKIGMSYSDIQQALPKNTEQDVLSYIVTENVFILSVELPSRDKWSASFTFDSPDSPMRRPERLIELRFSAMLSSRSHPFESLVSIVVGLYGDPISVDQEAARLRHAEWVLGNEATLAIEYSVIPSNSFGADAIVDLIIKAKKPRTPFPSAIA